MMKNRYINVFAMGLALLVISSCTDSFLEKEPDERVSIDEVDKAIELFTASYPTSNYGWVCELSSDNLIDLNAPHLPASKSAKQEETHYNLTSSGRQDDEMFRFEPVKSSTSNDTPADLWTTYYLNINQINEGLASLNEMEKKGAAVNAKFKAARAEGLLLRAYCHFILVNVFSQVYKNDDLSKSDVGVIYLTSPITKIVDQRYERENVTETYNKIRIDLENGLKDISDVNYKKAKWHFNTEAAHAFAARFYLYTRDWDKVIEHANAVLGTNNETLLANMFDFAPLDSCYYLSDFANVWQSPYIKSNLMLIDTYSTIGRKARQRYAQGSLAARAIYYHNGPLWRGWAANPTAFVMGLGNNGYGAYYPAWIAEQFEYTNKVAGIGYAHTIRREFTYAELLLERAEAKIMKNDLAGASADLITYQKSLQKFSSGSYNTYVANNGMTSLTDDIIHSWFGKKTDSNYNCFDDWNFVTNISPDYVVPAAATPYMNCLNYFRRFETNFTGLRFFDLKRWGIEYGHTYAIRNGTDITYKTDSLKWNDVRRAIEVPQEAIAMGLQPSRPETTGGSSSSVKAIPASSLPAFINQEEKED